MKNYTHHNYQGDSLCGLSTINLTTKQHLVSCQKCLELKPYKVVIPEKKVRQKQKNGRGSWNSGISNHPHELINAVYIYWLNNKENSSTVIAKLFDLTEVQVLEIINNKLKRK